MTVEAGAEVLIAVLDAVELIEVEVAAAVAFTEGREAVEVSRKLVKMQLFSHIWRG